MKKPLIWIIAMSTAAAVPSTAIACDMHGMAGFGGGMHRFNPFAKALSATPAPEQRSGASQSKGADRAERSVDQRRSQDRRDSARRNDQDSSQGKWDRDSDEMIR